LEFLARSCLARIHPALLADPREGENVLHAFGYEIAPTPRSIPALTVFRRCRHVVGGFTENDLKRCMALIDKRNAELHSGTPAFEGLQTGIWLSDYFRISQLLLTAQGKTLVDLFGAEEAAGADKMIAAAQEKAVGDVKKAIADAAKQFSELGSTEQEDRRKVAEVQSRASIGMEGELINCPACDCKAVVRGERVAVKEPKLDDVTGTIYRQMVILPNSFSCFCCGLTLKGHGSLHVAGLGGNYSVLENVDPADYFGIETPDLDAYFEQRMKEAAEDAEYGNE
jgi:hypothetical protein